MPKDCFGTITHSRLFFTFGPGNGVIEGFTLLKGQKRIEVEGNDETPLKEGLVSLYMQE